MNRAEAEAYTQGLGHIATGTVEMIEVAVRLGVPKALGITVEQWVHDNLGGYVRLSVEKRWEEAQRLMETEGFSTKDTAHILGVDRETIRRAQMRHKNALEAGGDATNAARPARHTNTIEGGDWKPELQVTFELPAAILGIKVAYEKLIKEAKEYSSTLPQDTVDVLVNHGLGAIEMGREFVSIIQKKSNPRSHIMAVGGNND